MITIYTDGSVLDTTAWNEKGERKSPGGAAYVVYDGEKEIFAESLPILDATNNSAELNGIILAIEYIKENLHLEQKRITIFCDSKYAIGCWNSYMHAYKKTDFRKDTGRLRPNHDLMRIMLKQFKIVRTRPQIKWVKAHSGIVGNEKADDLAFKAMQKACTLKEEYLKNGGLEQEIVSSVQIPQYERS